SVRDSVALRRIYVHLRHFHLDGVRPNVDARSVHRTRVCGHVHVRRLYLILTLSRLRARSEGGDRRDDRDGGKSAHVTSRMVGTTNALEHPSCHGPGSPGGRGSTTRPMPARMEFLRRLGCSWRAVPGERSDDRSLILSMNEDDETQNGMTAG